MKSFIAVILGLVLISLATPAMAYVVEVTTSVDLASIEDRDQLRAAVQSAVVDILTNAIAFSPTVVTVQNARVVGDRIYLLLVIADADGEKILDTISTFGPAPKPSPDPVEP